MSGIFNPYGRIRFTTDYGESIVFTLYFQDMLESMIEVANHNPEISMVETVIMNLD